MKRGIVVYDSRSGSTKKVAETIAVAADFEIVHVKDAPLNLEAYSLLVVGSLNIHAHPSDKIIVYLSEVNAPKQCAVFVTFGMPLLGQISSLQCLREMRNALLAKGSSCLGGFICPGYHVKFKTHKGRPSDKDLVRAQRFAKEILKRSK